MSLGYLTFTVKQAKHMQNKQKLQLKIAHTKYSNRKYKTRWETKISLKIVDMSLCGKLEVKNTLLRYAKKYI